MSEVPTLRNWKGDLTIEFEKASHKKEDLQKVISLGEEFIEEIRPIEKWVMENSQYVNMMTTQLRNLYTTVFGAYNPRPKTVATDTITVSHELITPEQRKKMVREIALDKTQSGMEISDKEILVEIEKRHYKFVSDNPSATVSTIMNGFVSEFEKLKDKRGVFKRRATEKLITT